MTTILTNPAGDSFLLFVALSFAAAALLIGGLYSLWTAYRSPEARKIEARLRTLAAGAGEVRILKRRLRDEAPTLQRLLREAPRLRGLARMLAQSGLDLTLSRLLLLSLGMGVAGGLLAAMRLPAALAAPAGLAAATLPWLYVARRRSRRLRAIERQLPDALDLIGRALRAGHAFPAGLKMAGDEMPEPIAGEFRLTHDEINFGIAPQQALLNMAARTPSADLRFFVVAVLVQHETGCSLNEVLAGLAALVRERLRLLEKVRVLSAEGRLSAWVLGILPFAVAGAINLLNPSFLAALWTDPLGLQFVGGALGMMVLGAAWMRRIIRIHV